MLNITMTVRATFFWSNDLKPSLKGEEDKTFDFLIYDGPNTIDGSLKKQIVEFLEKRDADCSFFDGEPKVWEKIKG